MWRSHLRLALRSLTRDKTNAALGGASLAVALAACILIALFVRDELSYDRAVPGSDRISIVASEDEFAGERGVSTSTPNLMAGALVEEASAVEAATVTMRDAGAVVLSAGDGPEQEVRVVVGDSLFFDVFAFPFVAGDPATALDAPDGAVVTASAARRLFGAGAPLGRDLAVAFRGDTLTATVRGVVEDVAEPSSVTFDAVLSFAGWRALNPNVGTGWGSRMYQTYALRRAGASAGALQGALDALTKTHAAGRDDVRYLDVPLRDFRLSEFSYVAEGFGGDPAYVRLFSAVALLILALGVVNYVNLATARGARRAKEIGVRKALGSGRGALVRQFLAESVLLSGLAALAGLALAALALPAFNATFGKELAVGSLDPSFLVGLGAAALVVGVVAGLYPALYLSRFEPTRVLRGGAAPARAGSEAFLARTWLRRGLVTFQFGAAILLLVGTASVVRQLEYARSAPLGFEPEGVAVVPISDPAMVQQPEAVKAAFLGSPAVVAVAGAGGVPTEFRMTMNMAPDPQRPDLDVSYKDVPADADYADALGLQLAAGRWPDTSRPSDMTNGVVVNEAFVEALGWSNAEAVGRETIDGEVVGVVKDFHYDSFREPVGAVRLMPDRLDPWEAERGETGPSYWQAVVRFAPGREAEGLTDLREAWAELAPGAPFEPEFLRDKLAEVYAGETRLAQTFGLFALVAVLIAALGLVGLATYTAERRTKELGIRKALGASVAGLVGLLSREYLVLVGLAALIAAPVAVVLVRRWLEGFAYHAPFSPLVLVGAALVALALALASVVVQALRAARRDPIRALRSD